ncbi:hypothetical protein J437_LFUL002247 [Ladona fulva]|uniref:Secreted protein n=1 Tax=Ladona fulva TaxID=123851 RepID=A0A8K0JZI0_LADFU|nr:hypothetical protein J437_LFUL002247 [Ladona fulva]
MANHCAALLLGSLAIISLRFQTGPLGEATSGKAAAACLPSVYLRLAYRLSVSAASALVDDRCRLDMSTVVMERIAPLLVASAMASSAESFLSLCASLCGRKLNLFTSREAISAADTEIWAASLSGAEERPSVDEDAKGGIKGTERSVGDGGGCIRGCRSARRVREAEEATGEGGREVEGLGGGALPTSETPSSMKGMSSRATWAGTGILRLAVMTPRSPSAESSSSVALLLPVASSFLSPPMRTVLMSVTLPPRGLSSELDLPREMESGCGSLVLFLLPFPSRLLCLLRYKKLLVNEKFWKIVSLAVYI